MNNKLPDEIFFGVVYSCASFEHLNLLKFSEKLKKSVEFE